jgi:hypothetical protein
MTLHDVTLHIIKNSELSKAQNEKEIKTGKTSENDCWEKEIFLFYDQY